LGNQRDLYCARNIVTAASTGGALRAGATGATGATGSAGWPKSDTVAVAGTASTGAAEALTRVGKRDVFWVRFCPPPPQLGELLVGEAVRACVLRLHFEQQPCRILLTLRRPGADAF